MPPLLFIIASTAPAVAGFCKYLRYRAYLNFARHLTEQHGPQALKALKHVAQPHGTGRMR
jgi:hypothetical protein